MKHYEEVLTHDPDCSIAELMLRGQTEMQQQQAIRRAELNADRIHQGKPMRHNLPSGKAYAELRRQHGGMY
ncbi:hypothetical protein [Ferrimonas pelagia]|uniref:Uncharacterized protein n=1 Tax=Ferrimonas pelagia TaxID=1177826 RepID=A0ABP9FI70_9GAMM